jgi:pyrimidine-nucleoside phosphorylase
MSKKLAASCDCILLDVKYGSGAFMHTKEDAEELAKLMVEIGTYFGKNVQAEITSMNQPLGFAIGNQLEVLEAIDTLNSGGPDDFRDLCLTSGATLLVQAGLFKEKEEARDALVGNIVNGKAFEVFLEFVKAQGGDISYIQNPEKFKPALYSFPVRSTKSGYITKINTMELGNISVALGAGRETKEDIIDAASGLILEKKLGYQVNKGDTILTVYSERPNMQRLIPDILDCFEITEDQIEKPAVVEELISYDAETKEFIITKE